MTQQVPLISVYITNHNYGKYIRESIESVLLQTMTDFEIIIIDDGSDDNSRQIIEEYATHEKIKVIFQNRRGLNVTNNIAMRAAAGKYIMRLDADDYLDPNALLVMSNALENDDTLGLVFPDYYLIDESGNIQTVEKRHNFSSEVTLMDQPAHGACTMIRREFLMQLNGYDERYECQDGYELWVKFIDQYKVNNVSTPLFYYRQHGKNLTSNEAKILRARAEIKKNHVNDRHKTTLGTVALIPVRDYKNDKYHLALEQLDGRSLIDWKIQEAIEAKKLSSVIVSSPDPLIEKYVRHVYSNNDKVHFIFRNIELARLNIDLSGTIDHILQSKVISNQRPDALMVLSLEFPFIGRDIIDDAIHTMEIFNSDTLISARPETNMFFQHHGSGLKPILNQEKFSRLEREALYRYTGGLNLAKIDFFKETRKTVGGKVGHIIIDQIAAHGVHTEYDLEIAKLLAKNYRTLSMWE